MPKHDTDPLAELEQLAQLQHLLSGGQQQQSEDARTQMHAALQWYQMQQQGQDRALSHQEHAASLAQAAQQFAAAHKQASDQFAAQQDVHEKGQALAHAMSLVEHGVLKPEEFQKLQGLMAGSATAPAYAQMAKDTFQSAVDAGQVKAAGIFNNPDKTKGFSIEQLLGEAGITPKVSAAINYSGMNPYQGYKPPLEPEEYQAPPVTDDALDFLPASQFARPYNPNPLGPILESVFPKQSGATLSPLSLYFKSLFK